MANISTYLAAIMSAVYGEDVRGSIHDAIEIINDVSEVVFSTGTAVTSASSSSTGFYDDSLYLNTNTYELWKCVGVNSWLSLGTLQGADGNGIASIAKTSTSGLVDTYTITYDDTTTTTFTVTNGQNGSMWYKGTAITGTGTGITGFPGNKDDFYLNSSTGIVYNCTATGGASNPGAATWDYVMTLSGGGGSSVTVIDNLNSTSGTDALSANQGHVLKGYVDAKIADPSTKSDGQVLTWNNSASKWEAQTPASGVTTLAALTDTAVSSPATGQMLQYNSSGKWENTDMPTVETTYKYNTNATSGLAVGTYLATYYTKTEDMDGWISTTPATTVSSGTFTFSGLDDTKGWGYKPFVEITDASTNKNPSSQISSISGSGTSSMSITYTTDADNGATVKLRVIK
ncbi:MAG: hypothetical protein IIY21_03930 [Clostridiales bacterium]|nr:hypothetical protein [Clostridiales bacterium]